MKVSRITPVLVVESVESCMPFWVERLGFEKTAEVPHGERIGFVILTSGDAELMLQSIDSVRDDVAELAGDPTHSALFIEVADLRAVQRGLGDWPRVIAERDTFYGMRETVVRDPVGNTVVFAQRISE